MFKLKKLTLLPIDSIPYISIPFIAAYQFDLAYGTKSNRIDKQAKIILQDKSYWFNKVSIEE